MHKIIQYIITSILISMMTLSIVSCTTNNKINTTEMTTNQANQDQSTNNNQEDNAITKTDISYKQKYKIKDNTRINKYFKLNQDSKVINFDNQIIRSFNIKNHKLNFIDENYTTDEKTIHTQSLMDDEKIFYINDEAIGVNSKKGLTLMNYYTGNDGVHNHPILLDDDLAKAIGKKIYSFEEQLYIMGNESKSLQMNFIEYANKNITNLISFNYRDVKIYKTLIEGDILDIKKLADNDFVVVVKLSNNKVRFIIMNYKCERKWTRDYTLERSMEYRGLTSSTYNSFDVFFKCANVNQSKMIRYSINKKDIKSIYELPVSVEYISEQHNTYFIVGIDKNNTKRIYVCDRNYNILDQVEFGTDKISEISNLLFDKAPKDEFPSLKGIIKCDDETYLFQLGLIMKELRQPLINISKEDTIDVNPTNEMSYTFADIYALSNLGDRIKKINGIDSPYFVMYNTIYYCANGLITKVRDTDLNTDDIQAVQIATTCYAFYKDNTYLFTHSLLNDYQEEMYYDRMLSNSEKPLDVYIDAKSQEVLVRDTTSLYIIGNSKDKRVICNNYNGLELQETINLYKDGFNIFIYGLDTFYSYDESNNEFVKSEIHISRTMDVFNKDGVLTLYDCKVYHYNIDTHKLIEITLPDTSYNWFEVDKGQLIMNDIYYYDLYSKSFINKRLTQPKIFEGEIEGKYYRHISSNEIGKDSSDIIFYATPYIHYNLDGQEIKLIDYKIKEGIPYIIEYETNHLFKIRNNNIIEVFEKSIKEYDVSDKYLAYTSYTPKNQLYLYHIDDDYEEIICNDFVNDIYIEGTNIYYCNLNDKNLYRYNVELKESTRLTDNGNINSTYYLEDKIIYSCKDRVILMNKDNLKTCDTFEGNIILINQKNNEIIYDCSGITLIYNINTMNNEVISYDNVDYALIGMLGNKAIINYFDGPSELSVIDFEDPYLKGLYDVIEIKMNERYTIVDVGYMYGMKFYVRENNTMKYHKLIDCQEDYNEDNLWEGQDKVIIYYNDESIYFKKSFDSDIGFRWIKYTPSTNQEETLEAVDTKGLERIVGKPRGA